MIVVEIGGDPAVGFAGRFLALLGHRVIKVEFLPDGDETRSRPPLYHAKGKAEPSGVLFHYLNQGKESIAIDPNHPGSGEVIDQLTKSADAVLVDASLLKRRGLAGLIDLLDAGVITVVSPFGLTGPYASYEATSGTIFAMSGEAGMLPGGLGYRLFPDRPPLLARGHVADGDTGVIATLVTLAGLIYRTNGGAPVRLDVSKQEAETSLNRWLVTHYRATNWIESRGSQAYSYGGLTKCADGYVIFQPTTDGHWRNLVTILGNPEWADDSGLATQESRAANGPIIQKHLAAWASSRTKAEIFEVGLAAGLPVAPFRNLAEVAACPQYHARGYFVPASERRGEQMELPGIPFRPHPATQANYAAAPDLGEHTVPVLKEVLHLSDADIRELASNETIKGRAATE